MSCHRWTVSQTYCTSSFHSSLTVPYSRSAVNHLRPTTDSDVQALTAHSTCYLSLLAVNKKTTQTQKTTRDA